jgi:sortase system peptidoglycan-associated protein
MKKLLIASTIAVCLTGTFSSTVNANAHSSTVEQDRVEKTNEVIGIGTGALAGAAVGGPLGALIGGIFGVLVADDVNDKSRLDSANTKLMQAKQSMEKQQQNIIALKTSIQKIQNQQMVQLASNDEDSNNSWLSEMTNFETNLQFKTASYSLEDIYKNQLDNLALILSTYPQLKVKVTGYADKRGDSSYNKDLSEQRALAVKQYLIKNDVSEEQISIVGRGETGLSLSTTSGKEPVVSIEDLFFARKVNLSFIGPKQQMTAAN